MTYIRIKSRKATKLNNRNMTTLEHVATKFLLDYLNIDIDDDYTILDNCQPVKLKKRYIAFPQYYISLKFLQKTQELFRPLRHETHANAIIDMFIGSCDMHISHFEYETGQDGFNGWFVANGSKIKDSVVFNIPSVAMLKCAVVARMLMTNDDYKFFMKKIMYLIKEVW